MIKSYLEIERARFEERLEVEIDVAIELEKIRIPALILQPLVENAVKHGISKARNNGTVKFLSAPNWKTELKKVFLKLSVIDLSGGGNRYECVNAK
ncbi:MAG: hypothetical protein WKF71_02980 [Pyrinomonadaceae bacterium]